MRWLVTVLLVWWFQQGGYSAAESDTGSSHAAAHLVTRCLKSLLAKGWHAPANDLELP